MDTKRFGAIAALFSALMTTACGGGGGASTPIDPPAATRSMVVGVNGDGRVDSRPAGIDCRGSSNSCTAAFADEAVVTLTATPGPRQQLASWTGACTGSALTCTVTMSETRTVGANFTPSSDTRFSLAVSATGDGRITSTPAGIDCGSSCTASFDADTAISLLAAPAANHTFEGWGGACSGNAPTCSVTMGASRTVSASFRSVATAAGWGALARLAGPGASAPVVAIDANDRATAVWLRRAAGSSENHVWASRSSGGSVWTTPVRLESNVGNALNLRLAIDRNSGFGMLLWTQTGATQDLHARALDPVNGWGPEVRVENSAGTVGPSSVGVDGSGNAVAVWSQIGPATRFSVYASRYTRTGGWTAPVLVENNEVVGSQDGDAIVGVTPGGDALTVWKRSGAGAGDGLWSSRFSAPTGWSTPVQVVADAGSLQTIARHDLSVDANGHALLVWGQLDIASGAGNNGLWFKRYTAGSWQQIAASVAPATQNNQGFISTPVLRGNAAGDNVVAWVDADNSLRAAVARSGGAFGAPQTLRAANAGTWVGLPAIAMDDQVGALAAWADPVSLDAMVARHTLATGWSAAAPNETYPDPSYPPALGMNERGHAVMGWAQSFTGVGDELVLRRFVSGR